MKPNIYTVPPGRAFLDCLATSILEGNLPRAGGRAPEPLDLPAITLLLPTRRATRALQEAFLRVAGGKALLLPKIAAIAEGQEDLSLLTGMAGTGAEGLDGASIPPAMSEMERRLTLTRLVMSWSEAMRAAADGEGGRTLAPFAAAGAGTPAQAATLATELGRLLDMVETEGATLDGLAALVPEGYSAHWQQTLDFLKIVTEHWPAHLAEKGMLSRVERRNAVILAEAKRLASAPPPGPVIVAGVTGSIPATVALMRAVLALDRGAIVLPALDTHLDAASWDLIAPADATVPGHPEHPQFGLKKLIDDLGVSRADVSLLPGTERAAGQGGREAFFSEAMRPARTTDLWQTYTAGKTADETRAALDGLCLIEAPTAQDEAEAVALILREAAETPGKTAALVSPDRLLARRVAIRLEAWGIKVDDSAGRPFAKTVPGTFLDLLVEAVAKDFAPPETMALLAHPCTRLGLNPFDVRKAARALELAAFRRPYLGAGLEGIMAALDRAYAESAPDSTARPHRAVRRLREADWAGARDLVQRLETAVRPLAALYNTSDCRPLQDFAQAHAAAAESIARLPEDTGDDAAPTPLWQGEAGEAAAQFFAGLLAEDLPRVEITAADYADLYRSLIVGEAVRPRVPVHPRLNIWGPFEARLQQPDLVILGSLNDGTWPESADPGPWLNRPMRAALGLPSPEEKIGLSAHDFSTLLGAPQVILTRAEKKEGVPTVPSRWLLRIKALLTGLGAPDALAPQVPWLGWARDRDRIAGGAVRLVQPAPCPAVAMRPRRLSVSRIEAWIANPYAIFAREILGLEPLDALGQEPGPALRGSIIHDALSRFAKAYPRELPENAAARLVQFAKDALDAYAAHPRIASFWVPRFERFAQWFFETEAARREGVEAIVAETGGSVTFDAPAGPFTLTARADRIDVMADGVVITDYKTGALPSDRKVTTFLSPQLPLEAAIALGSSGFAEVPQRPVKALRFIGASGGEPPGEVRDIATGEVEALARDALAGLMRHVARFDDPATPYRPLRRAGFSYDYDDYAHLARVAEWSGGAVRAGEE